MNDGGQALVELEGVWRTYGEGNLAVHALKDVALRIGEGEFIVVLGPSGSGKTTMLNLIGGIDTATKGKVLVAGQELNAMKEKALNSYRRKNVGFVFQFFNLIPGLTAAENVDLAAELVDGPRDTMDVLTEVGLEKRANHFPSQLSGGEQQRVAVARALVKNPAVMLCDEPTGELDYKTGRTVLASMRRINEEEGRTFLLVTHNTVIAQAADRVISLSGGEVVGDETNPSPVPPVELRW